MKIRATDPVAILFIANDSCQFVKFVGKKNNSRHFRCARKRQSQVVPVVVIKQPLIALVPIRAIRGQKISLRTSAWNFRASERRAELVRAMPSAAENLEEVALQSVAIVTGDEVLG